MATRGRPRKNEASKKRSLTQLAAVDSHSDADKARALRAYRKSGTIASACRAANIARETWRRWLEADTAFAMLAEEAYEELTDSLETIAVERAKKESDTLLIFLLKSLRRNKFADRHVLTLVSPDITARLERQARLFTERLTPEALAIVRGVTDEVWR